MYSVLVLIIGGGVMRLKVKNFHVANVNDRLIAKYKELFPLSGSDSSIAKHLIEKELLYREIETAKDVEDAKKYAENLYFSSVGEWVDQKLRSLVENRISICKNCPCKESDDFCPIHNCYVNPNSQACFDQKGN